MRNNILTRTLQLHDTYEESGGDFPGALNCFCNLNIGHASAPVEKSTAINHNCRLGYNQDMLLSNTIYSTPVQRRRKK